MSSGKSAGGGDLVVPVAAPHLFTGPIPNPIETVLWLLASLEREKDSGRFPQGGCAPPAVPLELTYSHRISITFPMSSSQSVMMFWGRVGSLDDRIWAGRRSGEAERPNLIPT